MEITPEVQAQLNEQKKQCPFCKIIDGETESKKVYEDKLMVGVLDINPWIKGHTLLMPKEHYPIMPYIPPETFTHMFEILPKLVGAYKKSFLCMGFNVLIANGGVAGQQSPHFLIHLLPRDKGDKLNKFGLDEDKPVEENKLTEANKIFANNLPLMIKNHFSRTPPKWWTGNIKTAEYLTDIKSKQQLIYEDEKVLVVVAQKPQGIGHMVIYSQEEEKDFENMSDESASHMFYVASYAATSVFEGIGAQGTNIILKSGESNDNIDGKLCIHVLARFEEDGIDVIGTPLEEKPDPDQTASQIKDETIFIEESLKEKKEKEVINLDNKKEFISDKPSSIRDESSSKESPSHMSEIEQAIEDAKK